MKRFTFPVAFVFGLFLVVASSAYGGSATFTGDSDTVKFPETMERGDGITYETDKILFGPAKPQGPAVDYHRPIDHIELPSGAGRSTISEERCVLEWRRNTFASPQSPICRQCSPNTSSSASSTTRASWVRSDAPRGVASHSRTMSRSSALLWFELPIRFPPFACKSACVSIFDRAACRTAIGR